MYLVGHDDNKFKMYELAAKTDKIFRFKVSKKIV